MSMLAKIGLLANYTVLYVEDNLLISEEMSSFLTPRVKQLIVAYDGKDGLEKYLEHEPDIVISDVQMPKMNGLDMIKGIREKNTEVPIVITTAFNENDYLLKAIHLQVDGYLMKPLNLKDLVETLIKVIQPLILKREISEKNKELENINKNLDAIVKEKTQALEYLYNHDALTGLPNSLNLATVLEKDHYKTFVLLDISNFSLLNKQYGKYFADSILKITAESLKNQMKSGMKLFKTESDTFVIILKDDNKDSIVRFCEQIIAYFDTYLIKHKNIELKVNFSIGIAPIADEFSPILDAEYALESSKKMGGRDYTFYEESLESLQKARESIKWLNIAKNLIDEDQIEPYLQPIVDFQTGAIVKYEVLARGYYKGEVFTPFHFIEPAQRLGLIGSITRIIVNKAFKHFSGSEYKFSINITQRDLLDNHIIVFLKEKLQTYNIKAENVTFEILENVTIGDQHEEILAQLHKFKMMGFQIAIDDFGIQNSNFSRLLEIEFDYLKLDEIFMRNLLTSEKDKIILKAVVKLAKSLGVKTVAEFVENEHLYEVVKECEVDFAQGYYIQKPFPIKELV